MDVFNFLDVLLFFRYVFIYDNSYPRCMHHRFLLSDALIFSLSLDCIHTNNDGSRVKWGIIVSTSLFLS